MQPAGTAVPTTTPTYTLAQLQGVIGPLLSAGKGPELQGLLAKYGVAQMTDLRADQMDLFAADLRALNGDMIVIILAVAAYIALDMGLNNDKADDKRPTCIKVSEAAGTVEKHVG